VWLLTRVVRRLRLLLHAVRVLLVVGVTRLLHRWWLHRRHCHDLCQMLRL
jgi:hypothetical protein